jgi:hypothetical protein
VTQQAVTALVPERPAASEKPTAPDAVAENVLDILRGGVDSPLFGLGNGRVRDLTPDDLVVPPGFTGTLGSDGLVSGQTPGPEAAAGYDLVHRTRGATHGDQCPVSCPG